MHISKNVQPYSAAMRTPQVILCQRSILHPVLVQTSRPIRVKYANKVDIKNKWESKDKIITSKT